jgi:hypothetical protein
METGLSVRFAEYHGERSQERVIRGQNKMGKTRSVDHESDEFAPAS